MSYITTRYPVPEPVFHKIDRALTGLTSKQGNFILHVLVSNAINLQKNNRHELVGWLDTPIELPSRWIANHFGSRETPASILTIHPYSTTAHRCHAFEASKSLLDSLLVWSPGSTADTASTRVVNLFDSKDCVRLTPPVWEHGVFSSPVVRKPVKCLDPAHLMPLRSTSIRRTVAAALLLGMGLVAGVGVKTVLADGIPDTTPVYCSETLVDNGCLSMAQKPCECICGPTKRAPEHGWSVTED